jgi:hypothetical protein
MKPKVFAVGISLAAAFMVGATSTVFAETGISGSQERPPIVLTCTYSRDSVATITIDLERRTALVVDSQSGALPMGKIIGITDQHIHWNIYYPGDPAARYYDLDRYTGNYSVTMNQSQPGPQIPCKRLEQQF